MDWSAIQSAIQTWAENSTGLTAVWMNQPRPMTAKPYVVLQIISSSIEGIDYVDYTYSTTPTDRLIPSVNGYRLINVQVSCISRNQSAGYDAMPYLELARAKLHLPTSLAVLKDADLAVNWNSAIIQVRDTKFDNRIESRAILDIQFRAIENLDLSTDADQDESYIEQISLSSDYEDITDPNLELTDEIIPQE